jgi:translation initiation factor 5A
LERGGSYWRNFLQLDVSDDGFLSLMAEDGETKDDVKVPDGEIGDKIEKLFTQEEKDTSKQPAFLSYGSWLTFYVLDVIVLTAMGEQAAIEAKEAPKS